METTATSSGPCDACDGKGFLLCTVASGEAEIQRCDACGTYESDDEARAAAGPYCTTCGSEIVETSNGSNFQQGECGPCEYLRYRSRPQLLTALEHLLAAPDVNVDELDPATVEALRQARSATTIAHGNAA